MTSATVHDIMVNVIFLIILITAFRIIRTAYVKFRDPCAAIVGEMPARIRTKEDRIRPLNESSHNLIRTKNLNFIGLWSKILYISALSTFHLYCHVCSSWTENIAPSGSSFNHCLPLNTYWAGLHLCWSMTKEHRLMTPLLPDVWRTLRVPSQDGQEDRLRWGTSNAGASKWRRHRYRSTHLELAN